LAEKTAYMQGKRGCRRFSSILQRQAEASMVEEEVVGASPTEGLQARL